jgi:hypothetical protein
MSSNNPNAPVHQVEPVVGEEKGHISVRILGVFILLVELGLLFAYGFAGYLINEVGSWGGTNAYVTGLIPIEFTFTGEGMFFYICTMVFTLIGFGCLYAAVSRATLTGFFISFFIVGYTTILSPTLQKFWFNVFLGNFKDNSINNLENSGMKDMFHYLSTDRVLISFYAMRISLLNAISQLVVFYGLYQRLNAGQIFLFSTFYQITWTLNYFLNVQLATKQPDSPKRLMDDYAINQVFLFGSIFALVASLFLKKPPREDLALGKALPHQVVINSQTNNNDISLITSVIGTFLLFLSFMGITVCFPIKSYVRVRYIWAEAYMNILFALCASVFTNMFMSALTKNRIGLREVQFGMIGGAIIAGPVAGTLDNIGAFMAMGTFAGLISSIYFAYIHPKINRTRVSDAYGALYVFIISLLGTFFVAPLVIIGMVRNNVASNLLMGNLITNANNAGWILVYVGISAGIALASGLVIGLILMCFQREHIREFDDENIFVPLPGLYDEEYTKSRVRVDEPYGQSAARLGGNSGF